MAVEMCNGRVSCLYRSDGTVRTLSAALPARCRSLVGCVKEHQIGASDWRNLSGDGHFVKQGCSEQQQQRMTATRQKSRRNLIRAKIKRGRRPDQLGP